MSPQRENETPEMYWYRLEMTQERQEDDMKRLTTRVDTVESVSIEAKEMSLQTQRLVESMPSKVMEAIEKRDKEKKMNAREIISLVVAILAVLLMLPPTIQSLVAIFKGGVT